MKLSFRALQRFVDFEGSPEEAADRLASLGFPNDGIENYASALNEVIVGKILTKEKHPEADRLSLLQVDVGAEKLSIVCGAQNMKEGDYVALAPVGAKLPSADGKPFEIKKSKIRGQVSEGMCCSESELGLAEESEGIWLLPPNVVEADASALGKKVSELFDWKDSILEVDVTPNRGDCLGVRGLARELSAQLGLKLKPQKIGRWKSPASEVHPKIENFQDASAFLAVAIESFQIGPTPESYVRFLQAMGGREISPIVDISNIVLFEWGHPVHFFDADKIDAASLQVRRAVKGEKLLLLDDREIELHEDDLVIADSSGPLSLAGVMGGKASSVTDETKRLVLEVACFDPKRIRATARRHGISSESSFRFERGLTPYRLEEVADRALGLIQEWGSYERAAGSKVFDRSVSPASCIWSRDKVEGKLGKLKISDDEIFAKLRLLDYEFEGAGNSIKVIFPWYRSDCSLLEDAMEDVARLIGYENLEKRPLQLSEGVKAIEDLQSEANCGRQIVKAFNAYGFSETLHASFASEEAESFLSFPENSAVRLANPLQADKSILRRSLIPQLLDRARKNASHSEEEIRLVEEGPVFFQKDAQIAMIPDRRSVYENSPVTEKWRLACLWMPRPLDKKRLWSSSVDEFFQFKGLVQSVMGSYRAQARPEAWPSELFYPGRALDFAFGGAGELHPKILKAWGIAGRVFVGEWSLSLKERPRQFQTPVELPPVDLDLSLLVSSEQSLASLLASFEKHRSPMMEWVRASDSFESKEWKGKQRALTFSFRYRAKDRSLSMEEAQKDLQALAQRVMDSFPAGQVAPR